MNDLIQDGNWHQIALVRTLTQAFPSTWKVQVIVDNSFTAEIVATQPFNMNATVYTLGCGFIGYLDDLLLIPLGLALVVRLTPPEVLESARARAQQVANRPVSYTAAVFFVALWLVLAWVVFGWVAEALAL